MGERGGGRWEPWEGGRKWIDADGKTAAYYIRKRVGGRRYEIRRPARSETAAHAQLRRFEADPEGYAPAGSAPREGMFLDEEVVREYLAFSATQGNSVGWQRNQRDILGWWSSRLQVLDLRKVSLPDHILPALKRAGRDSEAPPHRDFEGALHLAWHRGASHHDRGGSRLRAAQGSSSARGTAHEVQGRRPGSRPPGR